MYSSDSTTTATLMTLASSITIIRFLSGKLRLITALQRERARSCSLATALEKISKVLRSDVSLAIRSAKARLLSQVLLSV